MLTSNEIRSQFIEFFKEKDHKVVKSAPVIPNDDPTLLFTNAGMNQFKRIFMGEEKPSFKRAVDSQKCIRAGGKHNDLEEVGKDGYHHTFFEMLGNWSFDDYYKKEAIIWAWELVTKVWKIPKEKLYATVHKSDKEAYDIWKEFTDIDNSHIEYHGDKDNFWEMGDTGPCGPCSEIHIDRGEEFCNLKQDKNHKCKVNGDCNRFIELWNLVFIQYYRDENGTLHPLDKKYVDTGAGLERITQILQGVKSNYDTDLFQPLIKKIEDISGIEYNDNEKGTPHRVISDHIRALSFAIADGGMPSNEGRGYVLRRILRRAARFGRVLNLKEPFLYKLVDVLADTMGKHYSELNERKEHIKMIIKAEEERFNLTLDKGLEKFEEILKKSKDVINGKDAFLLYDTYGFPLDLTKILAEEHSLKLDEETFYKEMEKQRERARKSAKFKMNTNDIDWIVFDEPQKTEFVGYNEYETTVRIKKYFIDDKNNLILVLNKTPFYAESGGQVADTGTITTENTKITVTDVQKSGELFLHYAHLDFGEITDVDYLAKIDVEKRKSTARNHTAAHLLQAALREVLGKHVQQKGSFVSSEHLRFDFTHFKQVSKRELDIIEKTVNQKVRECIKVKTEEKPIEEAKKEGAIALFGEKYGDIVRVVKIDDFSIEFCGGTHLNYTGEIGLFKITAESSIAAGIRRIEAITGEQAELYVKNLENTLDESARLLKTFPNELLEKINKLVSENKELKRNLDNLKEKLKKSEIDELLNNLHELSDGTKLLKLKIDAENAGELRKLGDLLKQKIKSGIAVIMSAINGKVSILVVVTNDKTDKYHAGKIASKVASLVDGKGGGRPDMAMAGGKSVDKINQALKQIEKIIEE